jgi:hypothetical protein
MKNLFLVIYSSIIIIKLATTNNAFNLIRDGFKQFSNGAKDTLKKVSNSVSNSVSNNYNNLKKVIDSKTSEPRNEIKVIKNDLEIKDKTKIISTYKIITTTTSTTPTTTTSTTTFTTATISTSTTSLTTSYLHTSNATKLISLYYNTSIHNINSTANLMTASTELISLKVESISSSTTTTKSDPNFNLLISFKNIHSMFLLFSNITKIFILSFIILLFFCIFYAFSYLICSVYQTK